jgi:hypothetical protein
MAEGSIGGKMKHEFDVVVVGATSVLRGAVFGRRAGTHAAGLATR